MTPIRLGIAGCGFATWSRHLPALARIPEIRVAAVADPDAAARRRVAERCGAAALADASALVADASLDAIAVCVPAAAHVGIAAAALDAGKHVLVEKPLALALDDADRLLARARTAATKALVGFNLRWHRLVREARALVRAGALGRVRSIATVYSDPIGRESMPAWRGRRALGGGALYEKAVHHVDLWRFLLDDEVEHVSACIADGDGDDETAIVTARLRSGVLATALVSDAGPVRNEVVLNGDRSGLAIDCYRSDGLVRQSGAAPPGAPVERLRALGDGVRQLVRHVGEIRRGGVFDATYEREWRHFVDAIRRDAPIESTLDDGRRALAVVLAAMAADAAAARVPVDGAGR